MSTFKRISKRGFTLVELMIVVAIIGVLAALAIYGVRKYLLNAKTAEAKEGIGRMAKDAASSYEGENMAPGVLALEDSTGITHKLCESAAASVPDGEEKIKGSKYQSSPAEWAVAGWSCLKFTMRDPQYYMYNYTATPATGGGEDGNSYVAIAQGDLNGDGVLSTFTLRGEIQSASKGGLVVTIAPTYQTTDPEE